MTLTNESRGVELIAVERARQITEEGYTAAHDADHAIELTQAACAYVYAGWSDQSPDDYSGHGVSNDPEDPAMDWPWGPRFWKPTGDAVRDLTKAGALIAAALDSLTAR